MKGDKTESQAKNGTDGKSGAQGDKTESQAKNGTDGKSGAGDRGDKERGRT